jgi:hypothetical protein
MSRAIVQGQILGDGCGGGHIRACKEDSPLARVAHWPEHKPTAARNLQTPRREPNLPVQRWAQLVRCSPQIDGAVAGSSGSAWRCDNQPKANIERVKAA